MKKAFTMIEKNDLYDERKIRSLVIRYVSVELIKKYKELDIRFTLIDMGIIYFMVLFQIVSSIYLYNTIGLWILVLCPFFILISGVAFNWMNVQLHEASHTLLFSSRKINDIFCNIAYGMFSLQDIETYRATHMLHHSDLRTPKDPDLWLYTIGIGKPYGILRGVFEDLFMITAIKRRMQVSRFFSDNKIPSPVVPAYVKLTKILGQVIITLIYVYFCGAFGVLMYMLFYLYGLVAIFPLLVRVRTVVQHGYRAEAENIDNESLLFVSRSTTSSFLEFLLFGARMDYHFEHHLFSNIPYYNLKKMNKVLEQANFFSSKEESNFSRYITKDYLLTYLKIARV